jgi:hypothetical protein
MRALITALFVTACGTSAPEAPPTEPTLEPMRSVRVRFGARIPQSNGLSASEVLRPARFVELRAIDASGQERGRAFTDADGRASLELRRGDAVVVVTHYQRGALEAWISRDDDGETVHAHPLRVESDGELAIDLPDAQPIAGALHLLDTLAHGLETMQRWRGIALPPIFAHWGRGETTDWSYYLGETPRGSGRFGLVLMGGEPGRQASTDTDEHDEGIVLHELGHFVLDRTSGDSSIGGRHPPGSRNDPGVAWEEGRATFFAVAVQVANGLSREPIYRDTIGIEPTGHCRVDQDVERPAPELPRGVGIQESVAAILWDLADGHDGLPDRDGDGVALGPAAVLEAMSAQAAEPDSYPELGSFLRFLVRMNRVSSADLAAMLARTGEPAEVLSTEWPIPLALDATVEGRIDGLSDPAPSGGAPQPENGLDAVRAYRVRTEHPGTLSIELTIEGSGTRADSTELALELRDRRAREVERVVSTSPRVRINARIQAGTHVVYVRDGGGGNRAAYRMRVTFD